MNWRIPGYLLLLAAIAANTARAQNSFFVDPDIEEEVSTYLEDTGVVGLGLVVVHNGKIAYLKGYGHEDRELNVKVDPQQTRFRWASISKTLTGITAVKADSYGIVELDKQVSDYYPGYQVPNKYYVNGNKNNGQALPSSLRLITMRRLLSHMSGIQHYRNGHKRPEPPMWMANSSFYNTGMEWALRYWKYNPLVDIPGNRDSYSTPAYNLAGVVLEEKFGLDFDTIVQQEIAETAKMVTLRPDTMWNLAPRRAVGYTLNGDGTANRDFNDQDVTWKLAGGGYISTVQDMGRYAVAVLGDELLTESEKTRMWTRQSFRNGTLSNRGLGWTIQSGQLTDDDFRVGHGGSQAKARCRLNLYPNCDLAVGIMTNSSTNCNVADLTEDIGQIVFDRVKNGEPAIKTGFAQMVIAIEPVSPILRYTRLFYRQATGGR